MDCLKVQELISGYLDGMLDSTEMEQIKVHLEACSNCRIEYENLQKALLALSDLKEVTPPAGFRPALMAKVAEEHNKANKQGQGGAMKKKRFFGRSGLMAAGAAAAVLVLALAFGALANIYGIFGTAALHSYGLDPRSGNTADMPTEQVERKKMAESVTIGESSLPEQKYKASGAAITDGNVSYGLRNSAGMNSTNESLVLAGASSKELNYAPGAAKVPAYQRKVIRNGRLELEVKSFAKAGQQVEFLTENAGGYIESMTTEVFDQDKKAGYYTLRIPVNQFGGILNKLKGLGRVKIETLGGTDVTQEYYDTEARSRNLKKQELRLLELLDKAKNLSDVLTLENELNRVRSEIETMEGRLHYLDNVVDLATLQVELREKGTPKTDQPWIFSGILEKMGKQFAQSAGGILIFAAWAAPGLILLAMIGGLIYFLRREKR